MTWRLYDLLKRGPATTKEIAAMGGRTHSRRVSDLREKLKPLGWTVESKPLGRYDGEMQFKYWLSETLPLWKVA
jgi:hypothetical protein